MPTELDPLSQVMLTLVKQKVYPERLSTIQETILLSCWNGCKYHEIADDLGYDDVYIRGIGSLLWQRLSTAFEEKITKSNFRAILTEHIAKDSKPLSALPVSMAADEITQYMLTGAVDEETRNATSDFYSFDLYSRMDRPNVQGEIKVLVEMIKVPMLRENQSNRFAIVRL